MVKKDFRNMQQTQFDRGQVLKGSFSELNSALRTVGTNAVLKDSYTHFTQSLNANQLPTRVTYYQAIDPAIDELTFVADVAKSLAGTYFILEEYITKTTHAFYYVVDGTGTAPGVADAETAIAISEDDNAATVAFATKATLDTIEDFIVTANNFLTGSITLEYYQFGETPAVDLGTSGFSVTRVKEGQSIKVGEIDIAYDGNDNPIYNGNTLKGLVFNPYTAAFDVELKTDVTVALETTATSFAVQNIAYVTAGVPQAVTIPDGTKKFSIRVEEPNTQMKISNTSGGPTFTIPYGAPYDVNDVKTSSVTVYVTLSKSSRTIELITWT
jgi:hypothetical protein